MDAGTARLFPHSSSWRRFFAGVFPTFLLRESPLSPGNSRVDRRRVQRPPHRDAWRSGRWRPIRFAVDSERLTGGSWSFVAFDIRLDSHLASRVVVRYSPRLVQVKFRRPRMERWG